MYNCGVTPDSPLRQPGTPSRVEAADPALDTASAGPTTGPQTVLDERAMAIMNNIERMLSRDNNQNHKLSGSVSPPNSRVTPASISRPSTGCIHDEMHRLPTAGRPVVNNDNINNNNNATSTTSTAPTQITQKKGWYCCWRSTVESPPLVL